MDSHPYEFDEGAPQQGRIFSSAWDQAIWNEHEDYLQQLPSLDGNLTDLSTVLFSDVENASGDLSEVISVDPTVSQDLLDLIKIEGQYVDNSAAAVSSTSLSLPASLPASQDWPGEYGFSIGFSTQDKKTKGVTWTYNIAKEKLYVNKDVPCPINFSSKSVVPKGVKIRAMALYSSPESASEVVQRCVNHADEDRAKGILEAAHLVRCESPTAAYAVDPTTGRYSVIIPYENPQPGQAFSTYIFKFACFGSCPGPNRRPLMLVFSLMKGEEVIGRQMVNVKICACPGRDSKSDEGQSGSSRKRKKKSVEPALSPISNKSHPTKKSKGTSDQEGYYTISVKDPKCYEFLEQMKNYYRIMKTIKSMPPDVKKFLEQYNQRKGYHMPQL